MSGASSWLQKQRKSDLVELADNIGFKEYDGLKKNELELALDDFLRENSASLQDDQRVSGYFKSASNSRRSVSSPVKREREPREPSALPSTDVTAAVAEAVKTVKRRATKVPEEFREALGATSDEETIDAVSSAIVQTPHRALQLARQVPLPPSPAVVTDAIEQRTIALRRQVSKAYEESGIVEAAHNTREALSTVVSVEALIFFFEAFFLRPEVLPGKYVGLIPAIHLLGTNAYPVFVPDMFLLLTASFWNPVLLWLSTSLFVPLVASYFVNLTGRHRPATRSHGTNQYAYEFDPLVFNIAKALITYVVYGQDAEFGGLVDLESVARINAALYGGYKGVLTGSAVGLLVTLYEAALKK